jgi:hypothetical protein
MSEYTLIYENAQSIYQRIYTDRTDSSKTESLKARVKDPLWFISRQWQFGEFLAESCGYPVNMELSYSELPIQTVKHSNNTIQPYDTEKPVEWYVENEINGQKPVDWDERKLEYTCDLECSGAKLHMDEYYSGDLDWYDFILEGDPNFTGKPVNKINVIPTNAMYRGMPSIRYWAFEDGNVNFKSVIRDDENVLSTMLNIFSQLFGEDWYMVPLEQKTGTLRKILALNIKDNFNNTFQIGPIADGSTNNSLWSMFTLSNKNGTPPNGSLFFLPNTITNLLESDDVEEVTFLRDEMMNMAWAVENRYEVDGKHVDRNDELAMMENEKDSNRAKRINRSGGLPLYTEMGEVPENWIPYFPVMMNAQSAQMVLKRGKTAPIEDVPYYPTNPKGKIIKESTLVNEEEIPALPVSIVRKYNLVNLGRNENWVLDKNSTTGKWGFKRTDAGVANLLLWSSREKKVGKKVPLKDLNFDTVE